MALDAGVELMLHSMMVDSIVEDGRITGVVVAHKGGMSFVPATVTVDASGDGDVAAPGGASFRYGRDSDRGGQPMTLFFREMGRAHVRTSVTRPRLIPAS